MRVAGGLLAGSAVLAVIASFLPTYSSWAVGSTDNVATFSGWVYSITNRGQTTSVPSPTNGILLVLVTVVAIAAAGTLLVTARRTASRGRLFGILGAGMLIAGIMDKILPPVLSMLVLAGRIEYRLSAGWTLLVLAAIGAIAAGVIAIANGTRAAPAWPWAPGAPMPDPWGHPPPAAAPWPAPHQPGPPRA